MLRRVALRHSLCREDAEDALQRACLILLTKAPPAPPARLVGWMVVVTRHEALAVRRQRERGLGSLVGWGGEPGAGDPLDSLAGEAPDPAELAERAERVGAARAALRRLKAAERLAILLFAEGYSYAEIGELCGWTYTKVNRCLAEGRARLRARPS